MFFFDGSTHLASAVVMKTRVLTTLIRFPFAYEGKFLPLPRLNGEIRSESGHSEVDRSQPGRNSLCKGDPGSITNPAFAASIAPKAAAPQKAETGQSSWKAQTGEPRLESPDR
jgi:hypothetical protein